MKPHDLKRQFVSLFRNESVFENFCWMIMSICRSFGRNRYSGRPRLTRTTDTHCTQSFKRFLKTGRMEDNVSMLKKFVNRNFEDHSLYLENTASLVGADVVVAKKGGRLTPEERLVTRINYNE